ncbi:MAG: hypothetical protein HUU14_11535 [Dehalococcoidia bacterium]|nr:hypothetical protein [Dehalococcoidia bacterium]
MVQTLPEAWHSAPVELARNGNSILAGVRLVEADVVAEENRYRHDPAKLAATILRLYYERDSAPASAARQRADETLLITR